MAVVYDMVMLATGLGASLAPSWPVMVAASACSCAAFLAVLVLVWNMFRSALQEVKAATLCSAIITTALGVGTYVSSIELLVASFSFHAHDLLGGYLPKRLAFPSLPRPTALGVRLTPVLRLAFVVGLIPSLAAAQRQSTQRRP